MLTVKKVPAATAVAYADYLEGKTVASVLGDYYLKNGERVEAPGRWVQGAQTVGANPTQGVDPQLLRELMAVRHPVTGEPLRQSGAGGGHVAALDATFSVPKSVSAVWAVADLSIRGLIEHAHETAIDQALAYGAQQVPLARQRVDGGDPTPIRVAELIASSWRHTTARAVDGHPPDPQLHSHVLIHAGVRRDGKLVAIDSRALLTHRRELGAAYRTELARGLSQLGYRIQRGTGQGGRYFEIDGVPQLLTDIWSSRHRQVQAAIRQRLQRTNKHALTPSEERLLGLSTRAGKHTDTTIDLDRQWNATAEHYGFGPDERAETRDTQPLPVTPIDPDAVAAALTEFDATFTRTQARAVALEQNPGVPIRRSLSALSSLRTDGELLRLADGRLTTRRHRQWEHETVDSVQHAAARRTSPLPLDIVRAETAALDDRLRERGGHLTDEQRTALELATSDRQLVVIEGQAGSGKSTVLQAIGRAHQDWGQQIIVTSTSALAAARLDDELAKAGVVALAFSTAALDQAIRNGRIELTPDHTIIHDEAALASTRELRPLLAEVETSGARLILVGDPHQNQPVGAGGLWLYIDAAARGSGAHVPLTRNVRAQNPEDRRDQLLFRQGEHTQALDGYAARGHVHIHDEQATAEDAALEAAHTDREAGLRTIVIAQTSNHHLDELNARVQAIRLQNRELGTAVVAVPGRPYELHPGDEVQIRKTTEAPDGSWLRNGTTGVVTDVDTQAKTLRLHLTDAREITLTQDGLAEADVRLAYVQHPFSAQGVTTDTTHLIAAENATGGGSYVALTRARQRSDVYASSEFLERPSELETDELAQKLGSQESDLASIDQPVKQETMRPVSALRPGCRDTSEAGKRDGAHANERDEGLSWERSP